MEKRMADTANAPGMPGRTDMLSRPDTRAVKNAAEAADAGFPNIADQDPWNVPNRAELRQALNVVFAENFGKRRMPCKKCNSGIMGTNSADALVKPKATAGMLAEAKSPDSSRKPGEDVRRKAGRTVKTKKPEAADAS